MADFDPTDVEVYVQTIDYIGGGQDKELDTSVFDLPVEAFQDADRVMVTMHYPDGTEDTRWFAGPWEDYDDLYFDIYEWMEEGS